MLFLQVSARFGGPVGLVRRACHLPRARRHGRSWPAGPWWVRSGYPAVRAPNGPPGRRAALTAVARVRFARHV